MAAASLVTVGDESLLGEDATLGSIVIGAGIPHSAAYARRSVKNLYPEARQAVRRARKKALSVVEVPTGPPPAWAPHTTRRETAAGTDPTEDTLRVLADARRDTGWLRIGSLVQEIRGREDLWREITPAAQRLANLLYFDAAMALEQRTPTPLAGLLRDGDVVLAQSAEARAAAEAEAEATGVMLAGRVSAARRVVLWSEGGNWSKFRLTFHSPLPLLVVVPVLTPPLALRSSVCAVLEWGRLSEAVVRLPRACLTAIVAGWEAAAWDDGFAALLRWKEAKVGRRIQWVGDDDGTPAPSIVTVGSDGRLVLEH